MASQSNSWAVKKGWILRNNLQKLKIYWRKKVKNLTNNSKSRTRGLPNGLQVRNGPSPKVIPFFSLVGLYKKKLCSITSF